MKKTKQLPYKEPPYCTYQYMAGTGVAALRNPTAYNHYLNLCMVLKCEKTFLTGYTSPRLVVNDAALECLPFMERVDVRRSFIDGFELPIIKRMLDEEYYVCFNVVDAFYIDGMLWSKESHNLHDGLICGYDDKDQTLTIAAYDSRWIYGIFRTPQKKFVKALASAKERGGYDGFIAIKPRDEKIPLNISVMEEKLEEYLTHDPNDSEFEDQNQIYEIDVHDYLGLYMQYLLEGEIPYNRKDRRFMRLIYEHKRCMEDRINAVTEQLEKSRDLCTKYAPVVESAKRAHTYYASYRLKQKNELLCLIQKELTFMKRTEEAVLPEFLILLKEGLKNVQA